jgi:hypothetical protein
MMKKLQKSAFFIACMTVVFSFSACRNNETQETRVDGIKFAESSKSLYVGEIRTIGMSVTPAEVKNKEKVIYSVSKAGIIDIKEGSTNDGIIIEAISSGTVVVSGTLAGFVDYCSITVEGGEKFTVPYIITPVSVIEVPIRERRSITVSLAGGTPVDNSGFTWTYTNQNVINFEYTGNVGILETVETGSSVITVRHPKAQYPVDILVFVLGNGETPVYITSDKNVINLTKNINIYEFQVNLIGGTAEDEGRFVYQITEGRNIINCNGNGKYGAINPVAAGLAVIRITHPKAQYPYDIQVSVSGLLDFHYINVNKSVVLLNEGENTVVEAKFVGEAPQDVNDKYNFTLNEEGIVSVTQSQGLFFINADRKGKTLLRVTNTYSDFDRELLIIVNKSFEGIVDNQKYIYTNQNLITMEENGSDAVLRMVLIGGNSGDVNSFVWTVDDSSIIDAKTEHGSVKYRSMYRALYEDMPFEQFEAQAIITPKKTGIVKITLSHPKSKNEATVLVKVYPKKTFANVPAVLGGKPYYKIQRGNSLEITLQVDSGDPKNLGNLTWKVEKGAIAEVTNAGLTGIIKGLSNGITNLTVYGDNLKHPFSAVVIVNGEQDLDKQKFIYVFNPFVNLTMGQTVTMNIIGENLTDEEMLSINYINGESSVLQVTSNKNQMSLTGLKPGNSEILVKGNDTNEIKISVTVEEPKVNIEQPFYLTSIKNVMGIVKNRNENIEISLVGGNSSKFESSIIWSVDNGNIARITGNGKNALVTGIAEGQTVINASHPKSVNSLKIVVFVVANTSDLNNKVVFFTEKNNYLIERGERLYIPLLTNASDAQKEGIWWSVDNPDIIDFNISSDKTSVFITGLQTGVARISVNHSQNVIPQLIYISVVSRKQGIKYINVPSIVETISGNNLMIQAVTQNLESNEIENITWRVDNQNIANIAGNGEKCILQANTNGIVVVTVELKSLDFSKNIIVYIYSGYEEMSVSYVMAAEKSFYRMQKDDIIDVTLTFGAKGFPEHELNNIRWSVSSNNVVSVVGNGKKASVRALNSGIAYVYAESGTARNKKITVEIEVVDKTGISGGYHFDIAAKDRIKGIVNGSYADILVKLFDGTTEILSGLNKMEFEAEDSSVIMLTVIDNNVRVTAKKTGRSYITIKHPSVDEIERLLVYTADSQKELDASYPLSFEKNNYLLKKGSIIRISAGTIDNDETKLSKIRFEVAGTGIISISEISRKEITVSALEKGNDVILVKYDNEIVQRIYISVTLTVDSDLATYLLTESIIGIVVGAMYETKVNTNIQSYMMGMLVWYSDDADIISVESFNGIRAVLRAHKTGKTCITVKTGNIERKILVFACPAEADLNNYQAINIDQRYFVINKGQSLSLNIFSYQGKVQGTTQYEDYYNPLENFVNVIELSNKTAGNVTINGRQEGIAGIKITNSFYHEEIIVYIEVQNNGTGSINGFSSNNYITSNQTLLVIEPAERNVKINVEVIGSSFFQYGYFSWEGYDSSVIEVQSSGNEAVINPLKQGQTIITVRNPYCDNELPIMVIIGNRYFFENKDEPYIYVETTVYELNVNDSPLIVYYEVRNLPGFDYKNINYSINGNSVNISAGNPGRLEVTPIYGGLTSIKINAFNNLTVDLYFIVQEKELSSIIYLTTVDNFVIGSINEIKYVDVRLVGYEEIDSNQFKWSINNKQIAQVMGNGPRGQIYPVGEGDAIITVTHHKAKYPIAINVRITKNSVQNQLVYLTTQTNVLETFVGEENYLYVQKIGGTKYMNSCEWAVDDPTILTITGNEYTGTLKIKKAGIARITVTNVESIVPLQIVLIAKEKTGSPLFITSSDTLISLLPGHTNYRVSVNLAGGNDTDNARFNWSVYYQNPVDVKIAKNNGNVITLVANANQCNITAVNEGIARIRIAHNRADSPIYITVQVSKYNHIEFPYNEKQILAGESEFIPINVPNYENFREKVYFVSDNPAVCTMVGTSSTAMLTGHAKGYAIVKAKIEGMDQEAELYVNVAEIAEPDTRRIVVGQTSYSFNPRSNPEYIQAAVYGANLNDSDNDNIWWELIKADGSSDPVIDIFPTAAMNKELGSRAIQISPRQEGEAQIIIGHRFVNPKYYKTIHIQVSETNNALALNKNMILLESGAEELKASIIGAKSKDYDDIVWETGKLLMPDGTLKEVVKAFGSGQTITLVPVSDGTVQIMARYKQFRASCTVTVKSQYHFSVDVQTLRMYPGESVDLKYEVRPYDSIVTWLAMEPDDSHPIIQMENVQSMKMIRITALREGNLQIIGTANGKLAQINIFVKWNFSLNADSYIEFQPVALPTDQPAIVKYKLYPPYLRIKAIVPDSIVNNITLDISSPVKNEQSGYGEGVIYIKAKSEMPSNTITWQLINSNNENIPNMTAETTIKVYFNPKETIKPYFVRNFGKWSNPNMGQYVKNGVSLGENLNGSNNSYNLDIGDGEEHYIVFDRKYDNSTVKFGNLKPEQTAALSGIGVTVNLVDIVHNGNIVKALRLSGGKDVIEYDRVMFNKRLYVEMQSSYYTEGNNNTAETFEQIYWYGDIDVSWINSTKDELFDLWESEGNYTVGKDTWYFYTLSDYNEIIQNFGVNLSEFKDRTSLTNGQYITLHSSFVFASKSPSFSNANRDNVIMGSIFDIPIVEYGYFYTLQTINNVNYKQLFTPYSALNVIPEITTGKVYKQQIRGTNKVPTYTTKKLYLYQNFIVPEIDNFQDISNMAEDQYNNKALLFNNLEKYTKDFGADFNIKDYSFSFTAYKTILSKNVEAASPSFSIWNVFHKDNVNSWSGNMKIKDTVAYQGEVARDNMNEAYFYEYEGLQPSNAYYYVKELNTEKAPTDNGQSSGYNNETRYRKKIVTDKDEIAPKVYFYSLIKDGDKTNGSGTEGSVGYGVESVISGNFNNSNIFTGVRMVDKIIFDPLLEIMVTKSIPTEIPAQLGQWSNFYVTQQMLKKHKDGSKKNGGYDVISVGNSQVTARQRYYWEDSNENVVVPIERMLRFPLHVFIKGGPNAPFTNVYNIDEFPVPFRAMSPDDTRLSSAGVVSTPMPSINTLPIIQESKILHVSYQLFDNSEVGITFNITKKTRNCHARYDGKSVKVGEANIMSSNDASEIQGITNWNLLTPKDQTDNMYKHKVYIEAP